MFGVIDDVARSECTGELGEGWGYSGVTEVWVIDWEIEEQKVIGVWDTICVCQNCLIRREGRSFTAVVGDFGLAEKIPVYR